MPLTRVLHATSAFLLIAAGYVASAAEPTCIVMATDAKVKAPATTTLVRVVDRAAPSGSLAILELPVAAGEVTVTSTGHQKLVAVDKNHRNKLFLNFCIDAKCDQPVGGDTQFALDVSETCSAVYGTAPPAAVTATAAGGSTGGACGLGLSANTSQSHRTVLIFGADGNVCSWNRNYSVEGDPINVAVVAPDTLTVSMEVEGCALAPVSPPILINGSLPTPDATKKADITPKLKRTDFPEQRCFGRTLAIVLKGYPAASQTVRYPLQQYERYRGTLQFGVNFTSQHDPAFGLITSGSTSTITTLGPEQNGPEYMANVVIYGLWRYAQSLGGSQPTYYGRDVINDNGVWDRLGGVLGVGLNHPGDRFGAGLSFEILYGLNATGMVEFAKVTELNGIKVGDPFTGTAAQIPTTLVWSNKLVFGLSLDLRYIGLLFSGK